MAPRAALDALLDDAAGNPIRRALWLDALDHRLHSLLPQPLAAHARLANVDGDRLVYLVDSPVWHARLRLASDTLVDAARSIGLDVREVTVRTTTRPLRAQASATMPNPSTRRPLMSAAASSTLRAALASLDPPSGTETGGQDEA